MLVITKLKKNALVTYKCICGNIVTKILYKIKNNIHKSCGCMKNELVGKANKTHGMTKTPIYMRHKAMMNKCYRPKDIQYKDYGSKNITVCKRWHIFKNFYKDMGDIPKEKTLDRKDNTKGYSPNNCRWATRKEQALNTSKNKIYFLFDNKFKDIKLAMKRYKVSRMTITRWCGDDIKRPHLKKENCYTTKLYK